jgi:YHS domain-containing protein
VLALLIAAVVQSSPVLCPIMGVEPVASAGSYDYLGMRIAFCCVGCRNAFEADPAEVVKTGREKEIAFAQSAFDPVDGRRQDPKKSKVEPADHRGVRYLFGSESNRKNFLAEPEKYAKSPAKEASFCIGSKKDMKSYAKAIGYADFEGVRYYQCCAGCEATFKKDPAAYAKAAEKAVNKAEPHAVDVRSFRLEDRS